MRCGRPARLLEIRGSWPPPAAQKSRWRGCPPAPASTASIVRLPKGTTLALSPTLGATAGQDDAGERPAGCAGQRRLLNEDPIMATIVYAGYGVWNSTNNVTSKVRQQYNAGQRTFIANNGDYGDPSPGDRKYLYIVWDGSESGVVGEDDSRGITVP